MSHANISQMILDGASLNESTEKAQDQSIPLDKEAQEKMGNIRDLQLPPPVPETDFDTRNSTFRLGRRLGQLLIPPSWGNLFFPR